MGFDLTGFKKGEFSASNHNFEPLWFLVSNLCEFTDEQYERGCHNDFKEFSKDESLYIAECLEVYLDTNRNDHLMMFYLFVKDSEGFMIG
jgi:hypothetical protein